MFSEFRRQPPPFLRDGLRYGNPGRAGRGWRQAGRARRPRGSAGQVCISAGICRGCAVFEDCGLPGALSAKEALGRTPVEAP